MDKLNLTAAPSLPPGKLRDLPQVQTLLETPEAGRLCRSYPRTAVVDALRHALAEARSAIRDGAETPGPSQLLLSAEAQLTAREQPALRRVINATGIVLHTNLGRAPLPARAAEAMAEVARGYSNLEFDLATGGRGSRGGGVEALLCEICGAEAALAVNNAAAALLLALSGLAAGAEVIVSRGELVEIGGGFRIPEVIAQGGARLVEVGSTNKTRLEDYRRAIGERTQVLLKVHQSNYRIVGFTAEASLEALAGLAREHGLVLMHDLGSGALTDLGKLGRATEPRPQQAIAAGADLVAFSGDKLMGGPQAGLLVGRATHVDRLRRHPLMRALRLDKITLAGLEATLRLYRDPSLAATQTPVLRMLGQHVIEVEARAARLLERLDPSLDARTEASKAQVGGGSLPGEEMPSAAVSLGAPPGGLEALAARLRAGSPPVIGRLSAGRLLLDLFTVADDEVAALAEAANRGAAA